MPTVKFQCGFRQPLQDCPKGGVHTCKKQITMSKEQYDRIKVDPKRRFNTSCNRHVCKCGLRFNG